MEWISTEEKIPELNEHVLVAYLTTDYAYDSQCPSIAFLFYCEEYKELRWQVNCWDEYEVIFKLEVVTHWMPIPDLPRRKPGRPRIHRKEKLMQNPNVQKFFNGRLNQEIPTPVEQPTPKPTEQPSPEPEKSALEVVLSSVVEKPVDPKEVVMPFGKYKGSKLEDIPWHYLDWLRKGGAFSYHTYVELGKHVDDILNTGV